MDEASKRIGIYKGEIELKDYGTGKLALSDVLPAKGWKPAKTEGKFVKKGMEFTVNLFSPFQRTEPVVLYYEIYNLSFDETRRTHYQISYSITPDESDISLLKTLAASLRELFGQEGKKLWLLQLVVVAAMKGMRRWSFPSAWIAILRGGIC